MAFVHSTRSCNSTDISGSSQQDWWQWRNSSLDQLKPLPKWKLDSMKSRWDSNQYSDMGSKCPNQQLNQLCCNIFSTKYTLISHEPVSAVDKDIKFIPYPINIQCHKPCSEFQTVKDNRKGAASKETHFQKGFFKKFSEGLVLWHDKVSQRLLGQQKISLGRELAESLCLRFWCSSLMRLRRQKTAHVPEPLPPTWETWIQFLAL